MTTNFEYGTDTVEFYEHSDEELQKLIKQKEVDYYRHCMSPAYPQLGVNIDWFSDKPLTQALNELAGWFQNGYIAATSLNRPLYLKVQLKKPQAIIDADLIEVAEEAKVQYTACRYARNVAETQRLMQQTIERRAREQAAAAEKAAVKHQASEEQKALAELLKAHAKPEAKQADAAA
ncbi:hypothetical protein MO767_21440 [Pseudomonas sp. UYIF39]|uniref:hypothetical protein n=1 Tax=Pseudomonas sp. UYIF39 TaxID=1630747 RepID=UPI00249F6E27|nr:hypothetical protein [Pseudomonas sp. UYIF39]MDI3356889.1 hypothetical protein [Pseudomonas sp. UYIF39]